MKKKPPNGDFVNYTKPNLDVYFNLQIEVHFNSQIEKISKI